MGAEPLSCREFLLSLSPLSPALALAKEGFLFSPYWNVNGAVAMSVIMLNVPCSNMAVIQM